MEYVIWSNQHGAWWRANRMGYTRSIQFAGRYSREQAIEICHGATIAHDWSRGSPDELPVPIADLPPDALKLLNLPQVPIDQD